MLPSGQSGSLLVPMPVRRIAWHHLGRAELQSLAVEVPKAHIWIPGCSLGQSDFTA